MVSAYVSAEVTLCVQADIARANSFSLPGSHFQCFIPRKALSTSIDYLEHVCIYIYIYIYIYICMYICIYILEIRGSYTSDFNFHFGLFYLNPN